MFKLKELSFYMTDEKHPRPRVRIVHGVGNGVNETVDIGIDESGTNPTQVTKIAEAIVRHAKEVK